MFISQNAQTYRYLINNRNFESFVNVVKVDAESGKSIPVSYTHLDVYKRQEYKEMEEKQKNRTEEDEKILADRFMLFFKEAGEMN